MNIIYCFWTGNNEMSEQRKSSLQQLKNVTECEIVLITPENLDNYILPGNPLHPAYEYLSETHKSDFLRTYFMHFYGGGYTDIKKTTGSWKQMFIDLKKSNCYICGYPESQGGVAYYPYSDKWNELIGNCCYICKPNTPLTAEWYNSMIKLLDNKLSELIKHPSSHPQDTCDDEISKYPMGWNEMLGRIFHKVAYDHKEFLLRTLPSPLFYNYR